MTLTNSGKTERTRPSSRISGFYNRSIEERATLVSDWAGLSAEDSEALARGGLSLAQANQMIENVVGLHSLPLGIAVNFVINGRDYLVPMAVEEPSVVAGASYAAKLARAGGGFIAHTSEPEMIAQLQVLDVADPGSARHNLLARRQELMAQADEMAGYEETVDDAESYWEEWHKDDMTFAEFQEKYYKRDRCGSYERYEDLGFICYAR